MKKYFLLIMVLFLVLPVWSKGKSNDYKLRSENTSSFSTNGKTTEDVLNILTSISTIKGTRYYSQSEKEMIPLFTSADVIFSMDDFTPLPDPVFHNPLPEQVSLLALMEDSRFGANIYSFTCTVEENHLALKITNLTPLKFSAIKAVDENNFIFLLDINISDENILVQSTGLCNPISVPFMEKRINNAITNRINGLLGWFEGEIVK